MVPGAVRSAVAAGDRSRGVGQDPARPGSLRADADGRVGRRAGRRSAPDGAATTRLARPTLLVVDDADLRTGLIAAVVDYLRGTTPGRRSSCCCWRGPRAPGGTGWSASRTWSAPTRSSTWTAIPSRPSAGPSTSAARAPRSPSTATAGRCRPTCLPTGLDDPAYADPLLIHIAALLRTVDSSATPSPGPGEDRAAAEEAPQASRACRSVRRCCGRCASGNGPAGTSSVRTCRSTRTCPWSTRWSRWPR